MRLYRIAPRRHHDTVEVPGSSPVVPTASHAASMRLTHAGWQQVGVKQFGTAFLCTVEVMHVRRLSSGHWRWIVQHKGERRAGTARSKPHAMLAGSQALVEMGADHPAATEATMGELLTAWQAEGLDRWSPTYAADVEHVCSHLPAAFLARNIDSVDPSVIAQLQRTMAKQGWSGHRLQRLRGCLSGAFVMAVTYGWATRNPVRDVRAPHVDRSKAAAPPHDVVRELIATAPEGIRLFLRLASITGARRGELIALQWPDWDAATGTLTIARSVVQVAGSAPVLRDRTKTGRRGDRRQQLDDITVELIERHRAGQAAVALERRLPAPTFVFSHDAGASPWRPDYIGQAYRRHRATVEGGEGVRLHDLRHHVATARLQRGDSVADVAAWLGHATPATTLRVYSHVLPGAGRDAANQLADLLD